MAAVAAKRNPAKPDEVLTIKKCLFRIMCEIVIVERRRQGIAGRVASTGWQNHCKSQSNSSNFSTPYTYD